MFWHCYRLKLAVTVTWDGNDKLSMFGLDFLRITAIMGVAGVISCHRILFIAHLGIHFAFKHLLQHLGMQLFQELAHIRFCLELAKELIVFTISYQAVKYL